MDPLPPAPGPFTVYDNIVACGISDIVAPAALGTSPAQRVSSEIFGNVFSNCLIMTDDDIKSYIKSMSDMTIGEGRVKFSPSVARYLKAFIQFICDRMRKNLPLIPYSTIKYFNPNLSVNARHRKGSWMTQKLCPKQLNLPYSKLV